MKAPVSDTYNRKIALFQRLASSLYWNTERSKWFQYFVETFSNFQLISITFLASSNYLGLLSSEDIILRFTNSFAQIFGPLDLSFIIDQFHFVDEIFGIICWYFALFIILMVILTVKCLLKGKLSAFWENTLTYWTQIHHTIIFWVINVFLLSLLSQDLSKRMIIFNITEINIGLIVGVVLLLTMNYLFAIMGVIFCYDPFITSNPFASHSSSFQKLAFMYKAVIGPIIFMGDTQDIKWIFLSTSLALALIRYELILYEFPFFNYSALRLTSLMMSLSLGIALGAITLAIFPSSNSITSIDFICTIIALNVLLGKLTFQRIHLIMQRNISRPLESLRTEQEIFRRIFSHSYLADYSSLKLSHASNKVCNDALLYMIGHTSSSHNNTVCQNNKCFCHYLLSDRTQSNSNMFGIHQVNRRSQAISLLSILTHATKVFKERNVFRVLLSYVLVKEYKNFVTAHSVIFDINSAKHKSLQDNVLIHILNQELGKEVARYVQEALARGETILNSKQLVDMERNCEELFSLVKKHTKSYIDLWAFYHENNTPIKDFMQKSMKFEKEAEKVQQIWEIISSKDQSPPRYISALYSIYLSIVRNMPSHAEKIYNKTEKKRTFQQALKLLDTKNIEEMTEMIIYMSMSRERLGIMLHVSKNISKELGWTQKETINQNINMIQPPFVREKHHQILTNHKERSQGPFSTSFSLYAQNKLGYLVPIVGNVTVFPYVESEPIYVGTVQKMKLVKEVIIIRADGSLDSFSEGIANELNLDPHEKTYIHQICPQLKSVIADLENWRELLKEAKFSFKAKYGDEINRKKNNDKAYQVDITKVTLLGDNFFLTLLTPTTKVSEKLIQNQITIIEENIMEDKIPEERDALQDSPSVIQSPTSSLAKLIQARRQASSKLLAKKTPNLTTSQTNLVREDTQSMEKEEKLSYTNFDCFSEKEKLAKASSREGSVTTKKRRDYQNKIEEAVYLIPKPIYVKMLNYQVVLFALLCVGLLCYQLTFSHKELNGLLSKIELIASWQKAAFYFIIINMRVRVLTLIQRGLESDDRHISLGVTSYRNFINKNLMEQTLNLNQINIQIMQNLYTLDHPTLEKIYNIRMNLKQEKLRDLDRVVNDFEMIKEVANIGQILSAKNLSTISLDDPDLNFLLENTIDNPLVSNDQVVQILNDDYEANLYEIKDKFLYLSGVAALDGFSILIILFIYIKNFLYKRNRLLDIIEIMDENTLKAHLRLVSQFYQSIEGDTFISKHYLEFKSNLHNFLEVKTNIRKSQPRNRRGLNVEMFKGVCFTVISILIFCSVFLILAAKFNSSLTSFLKKKNIMAQVNQYRANFSLQNICFLAYMGQSTPATVRNKPIGQELDNMIFQAQKIPQMLQNLLNEIEGSDRFILEKILFGDFCQVAVKPGVPPIVCSVLSEAIGSNGLIGLSSNYARMQADMKTSYEESNRSALVGIKFLNSKFQILYEEIAAFMEMGLISIENMFKENLGALVNSYRDQVLVIIVIYGFIYFIFGCLLSSIVWKKINKEREGWRKILRQIPFPSVGSNKHLKNFLIHDCENILDSYKNMI